MYPPVQFNCTAQNVSRALQQPVPATKLYVPAPLRLRRAPRPAGHQHYIVTPENHHHPIHIHGYDFFILAKGFGNLDHNKDIQIEVQPRRPTAAEHRGRVPVNGWAVIQFVADNPGVWLMQCHLDVHITWGLAMAFLVEDGYGELQSLPPPPVDLPTCK
ncbi:hypothetical protein PR202_ga16983 [Eleusine coracana subsp. coracana]|uniref:Plastocyanin-like domain-containing protein n=1 Tax=Eleusine coracana subsp. coracana TaxID=191504 RepID=A0AAV5CNT5_ELECO|nr:hypothetical protein QOZ80_6AG0519860 [Eleusine coracana subsp. coracana]GJM99845.1 hypothetical protein PR202_ga16983 [Eleusine coracana subsp. coracana]